MHLKPMRLSEIAGRVARPAVPALPATAENIARARQFVLRKWQERYRERFPHADDSTMPIDLSGSCKASSMFAQRIFGGTIQGNRDHQFVVLDDGKIIDLNLHAADVKALVDPHRHDRTFFGNPEHRASMASLGPRVDRWVAEFRRLITAP